MKQKEDQVVLEAPVKNNKITVIFSTKTHNQRHIDHIKKTCGLGKHIEIIQYINNGQYSLTELYNKGLKESKNDIVVFCHDDIIFNKNGWARKLLSHFNNSDYGILGVAGTTHLHENGKWWTAPEKMVGIVKHSNKGKTWESKYSGNFQDRIIETVIIDGLFFGVNKQRIKEKFPKDVKGFHFYEIDFSFGNHLSGVKVGVIFDIRITHKSIGETNDQWEKNRINFVHKWQGRLPYSLNNNVIIPNQKHILKSTSKVRLIVETYSNILGCDNFLQKIKENSSYKNLEIWLIVNYDEVERYEILKEIHKDLDIKIKESYSDTFIKFIEYHIEDITDDDPIVVFTHENIEIMNDVITNMVSLFNKKSNEIGSIGCKVYDKMDTIFSCGQEIFLNKENKFMFSNKGQNSYYNYDNGYYHCSCGGKKEFLMISSTLLKIEDLFFNSNFQTYLWDLQMNLKLLNCNKNNYIDNDSLVKMKEDHYTVLHNNEIYKKYLNEDMSTITQYLQKDENIFRKAVKLLK